MTSVNFISVTEKVHTFQNNQLISTITNSEYAKITRITYENLDESHIENFNRRSVIKLDLFTVAKMEAGALWIYEYDLGYIPSEYVTHNCYHTSFFSFETMVPTTHSHLLNFRYIDPVGHQYFTVINKVNNQICEAGFIDRRSVIESAIVIDIPQTDYNQSHIFLQSNI